jgi:hypothetical protein
MLRDQRDDRHWMTKSERSGCIQGLEALARATAESRYTLPRMPDFKGFLRSTSIFVGQTVRHWLVWISAGLASLTSWATYVYNVPPPAHRTAYIVAGILLIIAFCWTFHLTLVERDKLLADTAPKFEIVFEPNNDEDSRPYLQTLEVLAVHRPTHLRDVTTVKMRDRRYRVGVRSLSSVTIPGVSLTLQDCNPAGNFIHVGYRLLVMDTDPRAAQGDLAPSRVGDATLFFDVVNELGEKGRHPPSFRFCYANENIQGDVTSGTYEITLRADGGNASATKKLTIKKSWSPQDGAGPIMLKAM